MALEHTSEPSKEQREAARQELYSSTNFDTETQSFIDQTATKGGVSPLDIDTAKSLRRSVFRGLYENTPDDTDSIEDLEGKNARVELDLGVIGRVRNGLESKEARQYLNGVEPENDDKVAAVLLWKKSLLDTQNQLHGVKNQLEQLIGVVNLEQPIGQVEEWIRETLLLWENGSVPTPLELKEIEEDLQNVFLLIKKIRQEIVSKKANQLIDRVDSVEAQSISLYKKAEKQVTSIPQVSLSVRVLEWLEVPQNFSTLTIDATEQCLRDIEPGLLIVNERLANYPDQEHLNDLATVFALKEKIEETVMRLRDRLANPSLQTRDTVAPTSVADNSVEFTSLRPENVKTLSTKQIFELVRDQHIFPYPAEIDKVSDPVRQAIILRFQELILAPQTGETDSQKKERLRFKLLTFFNNYKAKHAGADDMPAADTDELFSLMRTENWGLTRNDLYEFTNDKDYGLHVQRMYDFALDIGSRRSDKGSKYEPRNAEEEKLIYGLIGSNQGEGRAPIDKLKNYLRRKFVTEPSADPRNASVRDVAEFKDFAMSEDVFETAWMMFYTYDLFGVILALQQKWAQTRSHNTHQKKDPNERSRIFHVFAHQASRYTSIDNYLGWWTLFTSDYEKTWVAAEASDEPGEETEGVREKQELVKAFYNVFFPIEGMEHSIYPDPRDEKQRTSFIRYWMPEEVDKIYRQKSGGGKAGVAKFFASNEAFLEAKRRFALESALTEKLTKVRLLKKSLEAQTARLKYLKKLVDPGNLKVSAHEKTAAQGEIVALEGQMKPATDELNYIADNMYASNFDQLWLNMWDLSVFPDNREFITEKLSADGNIQTLGLFETGISGWDKLRDMTTGIINADKPITYDDMFRKKGSLWDEFVKGGLGLAKMVSWRHQKFFIPMTKLFFARCAVQYVGRPGQQPRSARIEFARTLVKRLNGAMNEGGGLKGIAGFQELTDELKVGFATQIPMVGQINPDAGIPPLLRKAYPSRIREREEYVRMEYEHRLKVKAPYGGKLGLNRFVPIGRGDYSDRAEFRRTLMGDEKIEAPLSRIEDADTTAGTNHKKGS